MRLTLTLAAFVFVSYAATLGHPFFFDDSHFIQNNVAIHSASNLIRLWTSAVYNSIAPDQWGYRPFTTFIHSLAWLVGHGETWPFHLEKILLHSTVCLLLYQVWSRLWSISGFYPENPPVLTFGAGRNTTWQIKPTDCALILAFVFAIHPANSEVLNYISATTTLLAGACYLGAYYAYLRFRETSRASFVVVSCLLYALAVLAKEEGITLVGVILLSELMLPKGRGSQRAMKLALTAYIVTACLMALWLRAMFMESSSLARVGATRGEYFITQWRAYLRYIGLLLWPWDMNADNLSFGFSRSVWETPVLAALCGNLLLLTCAWLQRRRYPIFLFALLWFYIAVSPASSVVPLAEPVNDRRMYLAYFGLVGAVLPWVLKGIESACRKTSQSTPSPASGAVAIALAIALLIGTEIRSHVWSSAEALWSDTVIKNPNSNRALNNLALVSIERGDWPQALDLLNQSDRLTPNYATCKINQAIVYSAMGRESEAEQKFKDAIALEPSKPEAKTFYAAFLMKRARYGEALALYRAVNEINHGTDATVMLSWAYAARMLGRETEALAVIHDAEEHFGKTEIQAMLTQGTGA